MYLIQQIVDNLSFRVISIFHLKYVELSFILVMENATKSIIYGNCYENRYGRFLPVCSSIAERGI